MKAVYYLATSILLVVLLSACKNRFETYEPYSAFDERMAASEAANNPYAAPPSPEQQQAYADQFAYMEQDNYAGLPQPQAQPQAKAQRIASSAKSSGAEVPFSSSRSPKHVMNIGALQE